LKAPVNGCNRASSGDHGVLEGDPIPSLKGHRQVTQQKCCFPGVLSNGGDMPAGQLYGHVSPCTQCFKSKQVEIWVLASLAYLPMLFCAALSAAAPGLTVILSMCESA